MTKRSDNRKRNLKKCFVYCICFVLTGAVALVLARSTEWFGEWYASHIFPLFPDTIGRVMSIFPFSVFEILIYGAALTFIVFVLYFLSLVILPKQRIFVKRTALRASCVMLTLVCALFMMLSLTCLVNYSRTAFADLTDRQITPSSAAELRALCELLIREADELSEQIQTDRRGRFILGGVDANKEAREAMKSLGRKVPELSGYYPNAKPVLASRWMSKMNITGIYSPFTIEANYNQDVPDYLIPFTICHELAHLKGFMREDEANFIAYLACRDSNSIELRYSGAMIALSYALNAYHAAVGTAVYAEIRESIPEQVRMDLAANHAYWLQFRGRISEIATKANDAYLRANAQEDGVRSYGRMVDLLLAEYRTGM